MLFAAIMSVLAEAVEAIPTGVVGSGLAAAIVAILTWFVKRQVASTDALVASTNASVDALKKAVDLMGEMTDRNAEMHVRHRRLAKVVRRERLEMRKRDIEEYQQVMSVLQALSAGVGEIRGVVTKGMHVTAEKVVVQPEREAKP